MFSKSKVERFGNMPLSTMTMKSLTTKNSDVKNIRYNSAAKISGTKSKPVSVVNLASSNSGASFISLRTKGSNLPSKIPKAINTAVKQKSVCNTIAPPVIKPSVLALSDKSSFAKNTVKIIDSTFTNLETDYNRKLKQLIDMKKTLLENQKPVIDLYKNVTMLRDKVMKTAGKQLPIEEIKIIDYKLEDNQVCSGGDTQGTAGVDEEKIKTMMLKIQNIANGFTNICNKVINQKHNIYDKVFSDPKLNPTEIKQKIGQCKKELNDLETNVKLQLETEENNIWSYLKDLHSIIVAGYPDDVDTIKQNLKLKEIERDLKETEAELIKQKDQNIKNQQQCQEQEGEISALNETIKELRKNLDDEKVNSIKYKDREIIYEKNLNILKNELRAVKLQKQDCELKLQEINNHIRSDISSKENNQKLLENTVKELKEQLNDTDNQLEDLYGQKAEVEEKYNLLKSQIDNLKNETTTKEMDLQKKLETAESSLTEAEVKLAVYNAEKREFTESITKYNTENENMRTELQSKNILIKNLELENQQLRENSAQGQGSSGTATETPRDDLNITLEELFRYHEMNKEIVYLRAQLEAEREHNGKLTQKLFKLEHEHGVNKQLAQEHENLMMARDNILEMIYERKVLISSENEKLEIHVNLLRDQINLLTEKYKKKQLEIIKLQKALNQKNQFIEMCEQKIDILVKNHRMLNHRSAHLQTKLNSVEKNFVSILPAYVEEPHWPVSLVVDAHANYEICEE